MFYLRVSPDSGDALALTLKDGTDDWRGFQAVFAGVANGVIGQAPESIHAYQVFTAGQRTDYVVGPTGGS